MGEIDRLMWEHAMARLRVISRLLAAVLVALIARTAFSGLSTVAEVGSAIVATLLISSLLLTRRGRELEPQRPGSRAPRGRAR